METQKLEDVYKTYQGIEKTAEAIKGLPADVLKQRLMEPVDQYEGYRPTFMGRTREARQRIRGTG